MIKNTFKISFLSLSVLFSLNGYAQELNRDFNFKAGDEFIKKTTINSKGVVERGKQKIDIHTFTDITKSIKIKDSSNLGYAIDITIQDMVNDIEAAGQKLHFSSKEANKKGSQIIDALEFMVAKPVELLVDKKGIIVSAIDPTEVLAVDTLLAFAGIQPEFFEKGKLFSLVGDFINLKSVNVGYTWADSVVIDEQKMTTKYQIAEITDQNTVIKLTSISTGKMLNSNINATYIVDNNTGIIIEKVILALSTGFRVSNKLLYATSRSSTIREVITKIPAHSSKPN